MLFRSTLSSFINQIHPWIRPEFEIFWSDKHFWHESRPDNSDNTMLTSLNTHLVHSCWHGCYCCMALAQGNRYANWDKNPLQRCQNRTWTRLGPGQARTDQTWPNRDQLCWLVLQWISHYWPVSPVHSSGSTGFYLKCPPSGTDHHIRFFKIKTIKLKNMYSSSPSSCCPGADCWTVRHWTLVARLLHDNYNRQQCSQSDHHNQYSV